MTDWRPDFTLNDKAILVTGGSRGLGLAMAQAMAASGATVILNGRSEESLKQARDEIREAGHKAEIAPFDVLDMDAADAALAEIKERHGGLYGLINQCRAPASEPAGGFPGRCVSGIDCRPFDQRIPIGQTGRRNDAGRRERGGRRPRSRPYCEYLLGSLQPRAPDGSGLCGRKDRAGRTDPRFGGRSGAARRECEWDRAGLLPDGNQQTAFGGQGVHSLGRTAHADRALGGPEGVGRRGRISDVAGRVLRERPCSDRRWRHDRGALGDGDLQTKKRGVKDAPFDI